MATLSVTPTCKKNASPCYSHRHTDFQRLLNCPAINFDKVWRSHALNYLFGEKPHYSLPLHAHSLTAQKKGFPVCGGWSKPQHRHPLPKKTKKNGFFVRLGCYELHEINTNARWLFAHFFRRLPRGIYLKNNILQWQSSKKIECKMKSYPPRFGKTPKLVLYLLFCLDKKMKSFFFN